MNCVETWSVLGVIMPVHMNHPLIVAMGAALRQSASAFALETVDRAITLWLRLPGLALWRYQCVPGRNDASHYQEQAVFPSSRIPNGRARPEDATAP